MSLLPEREDKKDLPKLTWISLNPLTAGGFQTVTRNLLSRLDGYNINVVSLAEGRPHMPIRTNNFDVYDAVTVCGIRHWIQKLESDIIVVYGAFAHMNQYLQAMNFTTDRKQLLYITVEAPPIAKSHHENMSMFDMIMTPCVAAAETVVDVGLDCYVLHHGIDHNVYNLSGRDESKLESFNYGVVKVNNFKGQLGRIITSYDTFCRGSDTMMYMHTDPDNGRGFPLTSMIETYGMSDYVKFRQSAVCNVPVDDIDMANFYKNMHVFVSASGADTVNLPAVEAASCGAVPILANVPGPKEYLGDGAVYVPSVEEYDSGYGILQLADTKALSNIMQYLKTNESTRKELQKKAIDNTKQWTWERSVAELKYNLEQVM